MSIRIFWASPQAAHLESATHSYSRLAGSCSSGSNASDPVRRGIRNRLDSADCNVQIGHALSFRKLPAHSDFANRCPFNRPPARPPACRHHRYYVCCATPIRSMPPRHEENSPRKQKARWRGHWREEDGMGHAGFRPRDSRVPLTAWSRDGASSVFKAVCFVTTVFISFHVRKSRQPGLATNDPAFVGWFQLVGSIKATKMHFDFIVTSRKNGRTAAWAKTPPGIVSRFAINFHRIFREYSGRVE